MTLIKPMLAAKIERLEDLEVSAERWLYASPKIDGIRCIIQGGVPLTRSLKPVPNKFVQAWAKEHAERLEGLDGELVVGDPRGADAFRRSSSGLMSHDGEPNFTFCVFDRFDLSAPDQSYEERLRRADKACNFIPEAVPIEGAVVTDRMAIERLDEFYLEMAFEGTILRCPFAPYLQKRATLKSRALMKLKRFEDSEAIVLDVVERLHNANEARTNALGHIERSSRKENMIPTGTMGALKVRDMVSGVEFEVGTGFSDADRAWWWGQRSNKATGQIIKYRYFPTGAKDKPRFPVFCGIRDLRDMS